MCVGLPSGFTIFPLTASKSLLSLFWIWYNTRMREGNMSLTPFLTSLILFTAAARAADDSFRLVRQDDKVNVYGKKPEACVSDGASVMFLVENKTKERLELKLELLNLKVKNTLTVRLEPAGNTSVLSLSPDPQACATELVDMQVNAVAPKPAKAVAKAADTAPVL